MWDLLHSLGFQTTRDVIQTFIPALSALATFCAICVSLYLAWDTKCEKISVYVRPDFEWKPKFQDDGAKFLHVVIVNRSSLPVRVVGIGWRVGVFRKEVICQELKEREEIKYGVSEHIWSNLDITAHNALKVQQLLRFIPPFMRHRYVRLVVITGGPRPIFSAHVPKKIFRKMMAYRLPTNIGGLRCVGGVPLEPKPKAQSNPDTVLSA